MQTVGLLSKLIDAIPEGLRLLPQYKLDSLILTQEVNQDPSRVVITAGIVDVNLHVKVTLHVPLRIEIERNGTAVTVDNKRMRTG